MHLSIVHFLLVALEFTPFRTHLSTKTANDHEWLSGQYCGQFFVLLELDFQYHLKQVTILYSYKYHVLLVFL